MGADLNKSRRYLETAAFIFGWMFLGVLLHLGFIYLQSTNYLLQAWGYLWIGIPLTLYFQLVVRKESLTSIWVRKESKFRLDIFGIVIALCLITVPAQILIKNLTSGDWGEAVMMVISILGCFAAAFAIRGFSRSNLKDLGFCLLLSVVLGGLNLYSGITQKIIDPSFSTFIQFLRFFVINFSSLFIIEENIFRGMLDSHLYKEGESGYWLSAFYVSILWGCWHLPLLVFQGLQGSNLFMAGLQILGLTLVTGLLFSILWRRTGNLIIPGIPHAITDAVGNLIVGLKL